MGKNPSKSQKKAVKSDTQFTSAIKVNTKMSLFKNKSKIENQQTLQIWQDG